MVDPSSSTMETGKTGTWLEFELYKEPPVWEIGVHPDDTEWDELD